MSTKQSRKSRERLKFLGLCFRCPASDRLPVCIERSETTCARCLDLYVSSTKQMQAARKSKGLCVRCGEQALVGKTLCLKCKKSNNSRLRELRISRRQRSLCEVCSDLAITVGERATSYCKKCYLKRLAKAVKARSGASVQWEELGLLFDIQSTCPYTGYKLTLGVNASLDHKTPLCAGGGNEIDNLQFVYKDEIIDINYMKGKLSDSVFKETILLVAKNLGYLIRDKG